VARRAGTTSHLARFAQGLQSARRGLAFAEVMALSVGIWLIDAADILLCADAVGLSIPWTVGPVLVMLALAFALAVPSTPAQVGAFELGCVAALELVGAPREGALAFAIVYHAMQVIPVTLVGAAGLRLALEARAEEERAPSTAPSAPPAD